MYTLLTSLRCALLCLLPVVMDLEREIARRARDVTLLVSDAATHCMRLLCRSPSNSALAGWFEELTMLISEV